MPVPPRLPVQGRRIRPALPPLTIQEPKTPAMSDFAQPATVTARIGKRNVTVRNATRLYVPGMLSDADQDFLDRQALVNRGKGRGHLGIVPLALAAGAISVVKDVFHSSAAGPNTDAAKAALNLALGGNLTAVKAIYKRGTYIQTQSSAQPYRAALSAIQAQHPEFLAVPGAKDGPGLPGVPEEWIMGVAPEQVVPLIQMHSVMYVPPAAQIAPPPPSVISPSPAQLIPSPVTSVPAAGAAPAPTYPSMPGPTVAIPTPPTVYLPGAPAPVPGQPTTASLIPTGSGSSMLPLLLGGGLLLIVAMSSKK